MPSEREKMLAGELYDPLDPELVRGPRPRPGPLPGPQRHPRGRAGGAAAHPDATVRRRAARRVWMQPPFFCDYGSNIQLGERVFFNFNCVVLDVCPVRDRRLHPVRPGGPDLHRHAPARTPSCGGSRSSPSRSRSAPTCGSAAGAIICPGVQIGSRSVIGAGSVVTRDIPDGVFAAGNPCRVIRTL